MTRIWSELPAFLSYYNLIFLFSAALATIGLSAIGCISGVIVGSGLAILRLTTTRWLAPARWLAVLIAELFRRIPFLVTLMLVFFIFSALRP